MSTNGSLSCDQSAKSATSVLAEFIAKFDGARISPPEMAEAKRTLINYLGCAIAGSQHETISKLIAAHSPFFGAAQSYVYGQALRPDALHAALINGTANNVYGFDDTHLGTITHPGAPVISALLALADIRPLSGRAFLEALIIGVEVTCRVAKALGESHIALGWHVSSTAGTYGAAAAAARALGLNSRQVAQLLAIAGSQPTGLRANFGTMTVSLHIGLAARNGLATALLAEQGFSAHEGLLDLEDGWLSALTGNGDLAALTEGLGDDFEILRNTYKAYASGIVTHPIIDGCADLAREYDLRSGDVSAISLRVHPMVHELTGRLPTTALRSKVSVQHAAAVGAARRAGGIAEFSHSALLDPEISRLRSAVSYQIDTSLARDEAIVTLTLQDGRALTAHVAHARGSAARPLTDADLHRKFLGLSEGILPPSQAVALIESCQKAETLPQISEISALASLANNSGKSVNSSA